MWARIKAFFKRWLTWTETEAEIVYSDARKYINSPGVDEEASKPVVTQ